MANKKSFLKNSSNKTNSILFALPAFLIKANGKGHRFETEAMTSPLAITPSQHLQHYL